MLAIDTATLVSTVALATEDKLIAEFTLQTTKTHSEKLLPAIDMLCRFAGVSARDLEAIAVSTGPGSFTGLRIGLATAKALSYANSLPLIGVPTLQGLAYNFAGSKQLIAPVLDAQKGNVYTAFYRFEQGQSQEIVPVSILSAAELSSKLLALNEPTILLGEATELVVAAADNLGKVAVADNHLLMPRAASVARAAFQMYRKGFTSDARTLVPIYVRRAEAEVLWEQRRSSSHE
jgi:tRNA threonylcarbamoyladenosine biosynthesis protein TsaB